MRLMDHARLKETLNYDPETGLFTWKRNRQKALVGATVCELKPDGRILVRALGERTFAHRLAWFYVYGHWPEQIDHINGNVADNRLANLRECAGFENQQNRGKQANNTSGLMGVSWHKLRQKWRATICVNRKSTHLGLFDTKEGAYSAYCEAKQQKHRFQPTPRA